MGYHYVRLSFKYDILFYMLLYWCFQEKGENKGLGGWRVVVDQYNKSICK